MTDRIVPFDGTPSKYYTDLPEECEPKLGMLVIIAQQTVQRTPLYASREECRLYPVYRRPRATGRTLPQVDTGL